MLQHTSSYIIVIVVAIIKLTCSTNPYHDNVLMDDTGHGQQQKPCYILPYKSDRNMNSGGNHPQQLNYNTYYSNSIPNLQGEDNFQYFQMKGNPNMIPKSSNSNTFLNPLLLKTEYATLPDSMNSNNRNYLRDINPTSPTTAHSTDSNFCQFKHQSGSSYNQNEYTSNIGIPPYMQSKLFDPSNYNKQSSPNYLIPADPGILALYNPIGKMNEQGNKESYEILPFSSKYNLPFQYYPMKDEYNGIPDNKQSKQNGYTKLGTTNHALPHYCCCSPEINLVENGYHNLANKDYDEQKFKILTPSSQFCDSHPHTSEEYKYNHCLNYCND